MQELLWHIARKIHMTSTKIVKSHDVLYDQITCHVYNNLAKFHQNWPLIIMHVKYKMYVDICIQYCTCTHIC